MAQYVDHCGVDRKVEVKYAKVDSAKKCQRSTETFCSLRLLPCRPVGSPQVLLQLYWSWLF